MIRSIVNGLRDDDDESEYAGRGSRASFTSEYSTRESEGGLQVFVKEHGRSGSKSSNSSFLARKKPLPGQQRPETKVDIYGRSSMSFCLRRVLHRCSIARLSRLAASLRIFLKVWMQDPSTSFRALHVLHIPRHHPCRRMTYTGL